MTKDNGQSSQPDDTQTAIISSEPFYLPQGGEVALFEAAYNSRLPMMLVGPTGSGKTRLVEYMAWRLKLPLYTVACHDDLSAHDLTGRYIIKGGDAEWCDGPLLAGVKHAGIVYLDEVVEARKDVTVLIHPLTDHRRCLPVEKLGRVFAAPKSFMLVVSYNPTYQSALKELKPSTRQRFVAMELGWPDEELEIRIVSRESGVDEQTAGRLVKAAGQIRNLREHGLEEGASTRELVYAGQLMNAGIGVGDALAGTLIEPLTHDEDLKKSIVEILRNYFVW